MTRSPNCFNCESYVIIEKRGAVAWGVLAASAVTCGLAVAFGGGATTVDEVVSVPAAAEPTEVSRLLQQLPSSRIEPAIVVYSRGCSPTVAPRRW